MLFLKQKSKSFESSALKILQWLPIALRINPGSLEGTARSHIPLLPQGLCTLPSTHTSPTAQMACSSSSFSFHSKCNLLATPLRKQALHKCLNHRSGYFLHITYNTHIVISLLFPYITYRNRVSCFLPYFLSFPTRP